MAITPQQARAELARRELARRQQAAEQEPEEDAGAYLDSLPEPEGFFSKLPRNIAAALASMGRSTINIPHDVANRVLQGIGSLSSHIVPGLNDQRIVDKANPFTEIPDYNYAQMLGQKGEGTLMDNLIQKGVEYAPDLIGGGALVRGGFRRLKGTHQLDAVDRLMKQNGLMDFSYPEKMIQEARKYLPKTEATKELLKQVSEGKYSPSFKLQSQIGEHQRKLAKSPLASENSIMAPKAGELKQNMLNHLEKVMRESGYHEDADLLRKGINNYRQYQQVKKSALKAAKIAGIPTSILAALGIGYKGTKKILSD